MRVHFSRWFCEAVCNGDNDPLLNYIHRRGKVLLKWLILKITCTGQKIIPDKNEVPLHDIKVGVWCITSVTRITEMHSAKIHSCFQFYKY